MIVATCPELGKYQLQNWY